MAWAKGSEGPDESQAPLPSISIARLGYGSLGSARLERPGPGTEKVDALGVEGEPGSLVDEGPDVGDEELLRALVLHVLELELGELLERRGP